jgi:hypothetical protein
MDARIGVSVEEYLHTSFPGLDREYRNGDLIDRSLPDYLHGKSKRCSVESSCGALGLAILTAI